MFLTDLTAKTAFVHALLAFKGWHKLCSSKFIFNWTDGSVGKALGTHADLSLNPQSPREDKHCRTSL